MTAAQAAPADLQFSQVVDDFVFGSLALSPVTASTVGYHKHHGEMLEDELDDFSAAGIKAQSSCSATSRRASKSSMPRR